MEKEISREYFVSAGDANPQGELSLSSLTNKIIEIATVHANSLHIGNPDMQDIGGGWVLSRLTIEMMQYPVINTSFTLTTWVEAWNRHFSARCFEISDAKGRTLGYARTIWMIINLESHENLGLAHFNIPPNLISDRPCPIPTQKKHAIAVGATHIDRRFTYTDIDFYRHVNTTRYLEIFLNLFSLEHFDRNRISRMEMSFMREGKYGQMATIYHSTREDEVVEMAISHDETPLVHARFTFRPR